jgi:hypothetical protein
MLKHIEVFVLDLLTLRSLFSEVDEFGVLFRALDRLERCISSQTYGHRRATGSMDGSDLESTELYSEELGIDLASGDDEEVFKWFLASALFGGRISEDIAKRTYWGSERHDL